MSLVDDLKAFEKTALTDAKALAVAALQKLEGDVEASIPAVNQDAVNALLTAVPAATRPLVQGIVNTFLSGAEHTLDAEEVSVLRSELAHAIAIIDAVPA